MPPLYAKPQVPQETHSAPPILEPCSSAAHTFSRGVARGATYPAEPPHEVPRPGARRTTMIVRSPFVQFAKALDAPAHAVPVTTEEASEAGREGKSREATVQAVSRTGHVERQDAALRTSSTRTHTNAEATFVAVAPADACEAEEEATAARPARDAAQDKSTSTIGTGVEAVRAQVRRDAHAAAGQQAAPTRAAGRQSCYEKALAAYTERLLADARRRCASATRAKARSRLRRQQLFEHYSTAPAATSGTAGAAVGARTRRHECRAEARTRQPVLQTRSRSAAETRSGAAVRRSVGSSSSSSSNECAGITRDDDVTASSAATSPRHAVVDLQECQRRDKGTEQLRDMLPSPNCGARIMSAAAADATGTTTRDAAQRQPSRRAAHQRCMASALAAATIVATRGTGDEAASDGAQCVSPRHPIWLTPHLLTPPRPLARHEGELAVDAARRTPRSSAVRPLCDPTTTLATVTRVTGRKGRPLRCHCDEWLQNNANMHASYALCGAERSCAARSVRGRGVRGPASSSFLMFPWDYD